MAKIVSLRLFSKQKAREEHRKRAAENAAKYGQPQSQREKEAARLAKLNSHLDGHKRDDP